MFLSMFHTEGLIYKPLAPFNMGKSDLLAAPRLKKKIVIATAQ